MEKEYFDRVELVNAIDPISAIRFDSPGKSFDLGKGYVLGPFDVIGMPSPSFWINNTRFTTPYVRVWWNGVPFILYDKSATSESEALIGGLITISKDGSKEFMVRDFFGTLIFIDIKAEVITHEVTPGQEISEDEFWKEAYRGSDLLINDIKQLGRGDPKIRLQWDIRTNPAGNLQPRKGVSYEELNDWLSRDYCVEEYTSQ